MRNFVPKPACKDAEGVRKVFQVTRAVTRTTMSLRGAGSALAAQTLSLSALSANVGGAGKVPH
jgi:hypothetical protein